MKRTISVFIAVVTLIFSSNVTLAADLQPYASLTLSRHYAQAFSGDSRGEIIIDFNVQSSKLSSTIGVESIDFYTVSGTTSNGLVKVNTAQYSNEFPYDLPSGNSYYAEVTLFARVGSEYDNYTVTTSTVRVS